MNNLNPNNPNMEWPLSFKKEYWNVNDYIAIHSALPGNI